MINLQTLKKFFITIFILWLLGYPIFVVMFQLREPDHPTKRTAAIVVLTGGDNRVQTGLKLFSERLSEKLYISGVHGSVREEDITAQWTSNRPLPTCCIILDYRAKTTQQNAEETKKWAAQNNIDSIRLVTGKYHMPRAALEFKEAMPNVNFFLHPVEENEYNMANWKYWKISFIEYNKVLYRKIQVMINHLKNSQ